MKVQAVYAATPTTGYGRMSLELVAALERKGVKVVPHSYGWSPEKATTPDDHKSACSTIIFISPPHRPEGWFEGQKVILLSMWESSELALEHLTTVPLYDTILVPSKQNAEMFGKLNDNVHTFNLGCNYDEWKIVPRTYSDPFTIITGGKGGRRKGIDITIKVFKRFRDTIVAEGYPHPRLIVKADATLSRPDPDIIVIDEIMSAEDETKLYASAHVCLALSRGEGWGMIPHQTIAQGCPTILTDAHGHAEFAKYGIGVGWSPVRAETEIVGRSGDWWEADPSEALERLLGVFRGYPEAAKLAVANAKKIRKEMTWDRAADTIISHIQDDINFEPGEWQTCPQLRLSLKVTKPISCNIGPSTYSFQPGIEYNVSADVKRVLYDAGYVDPSCVDPYEKATYDKPRETFIDQGTAA